MEEGQIPTCTIVSENDKFGDPLTLSFPVSGDEDVGCAKTLACTAWGITNLLPWYLRCVTPTETGPLYDNVKIPQRESSKFVLCCRKGQNDIEFDIGSVLETPAPAPVPAPVREKLPIEVRFMLYLKDHNIVSKAIHVDDAHVRFIIDMRSYENLDDIVGDFLTKPYQIKIDNKAQEFTVYFCH